MPLIVLRGVVSPMNGRARRERNRSDAGYYGTIQLLGVVVGVSWFFMFIATLPGDMWVVPYDVATRAYNLVEDDARDVLFVGEEMCCTSDPAAASMIQSDAAEAWACDCDEPMQKYLKLFQAGEHVAVMEFQQSWGAFNSLGDPVVHNVKLCCSEDHLGPTVATIRPAHIAERGPAHVILPLSHVSGIGSMEAHVVPLMKISPYRTGPINEHSTSIKADVQYTRTAVEPDLEDLTVGRTSWTEASGLYLPQVNVNFLERTAEDMLEERLGGEEAIPIFSLTLTKDQLAEERLLEGGAPTDPYPQHPFVVDVTFNGPGQIGQADCAVGMADGTPLMGEGWRIEAKVPRQWSDVEITDRDRDDTNTPNGWIAAEARELKNGEWLVTATQSMAGSYHDVMDPDTNERCGVDIQAVTRNVPFRFHARPPALGDSADIGFWPIRATVQSTFANVRQDGVLVVELASQLGRVHRTTYSVAPQVVPSTGDPPLGVDAVLGVAFANGGEATTIDSIAWDAPFGSFFIPVENSGDVDDNDVVQVLQIVDAPLLGEHADWWTVTPTRVTWNPDPAWPQECAALSACSVAALVRVDGAALQKASLWPKPHVSVLYDDEDIEPFVDLFVRSDWGHDGIPEGNAAVTHWAQAFASAGASPGPVKGAFAFSLPAADDDLCNADEAFARDRPDDGSFRDGKTHFDFSAVESGHPVVGNAASCGLEWDDEYAPSFPVLATAGTTREADWGVASVGKSSYVSASGLPVDGYADWRNGVAESSVTGPAALAVGQAAPFTIRLDSILDALSGNGVSTATLRYRVIDPYNAWEDKAWQEEVIVDDGEIDLNAPGITCGNDGGPVCGLFTEVPGEVTIDLKVKDTAPPGTHLFLVEIEWQQPVGASSITIVGRVYTLFDVVLRGEDGETLKPMPGNVAIVAWLRDWELPRAG